jgi:hypothetical protein
VAGPSLQPTLPVTVLVAARNEEAYLPRCLASLGPEAAGVGGAVVILLE